MSDQTTKPMSYTEAALHMLKEGGKPMHYTEITKTAKDRGYLLPRGVTPERSMNNAINHDIKLRRDRGELPRFDAKGDGVFDILSPSQASAADKATASAAEDTIKKVLNNLHNKIGGDGYALEKLIRSLLEAMHFANIEQKGGPKDRGTDLEADFDTPVGPVRYIIQAKNKKQKVTSEDMQTFCGAFSRSVEAHHGLFITTSSFTDEAVKVAKDAKNRIERIDGEELARLMIQFHVGIITTYEPDETFFDDILSHKKASAPLAQAQVMGTEQQSKGTPTSLSPTSDVAQNGISLRAAYKGQVLEATLVKKNHVIYKGKEYNSPSGAARAATGTSRDGWTFWQYQDPETKERALLDTLRPKPLQDDEIDDSGYLTIEQREAIADAMGGHQMDVYPHGYGFGPGIPLNWPQMDGHAPAVDQRKKRHPRHKKGQP